MKKLLKMSIVTSLVLGMANVSADEEHLNQEHSVKNLVNSFGKVEQKDVSKVDGFAQMLTDAKVSGQIKAISAGYKQHKSGEINTYASAMGGVLKYELASLKGFNAAVAFSTSKDIGFATGNRAEGKQNSELSSSSGNYTELSEAYLNYNYKGLNLRAGRQLIDTPLADSDDIRMIQNTFEAYIATYELNGFTFTAGNLQRWQGTDAGLEDRWSKTGENGTWMIGGTYANDVVEANMWYYSVSKLVDAIYADVDMHYNITEDIMLHSAVEYLNEKERGSSALAASIYGVMAEVSLYGVNLSVAYNNASKQTSKQSFSGFGGGAMYTSMDTMIIDEITEDRDAHALVFSLLYSFNEWNFLYSHGDFYGDENTLGDKAHIVEDDAGFEYNINEKFALAAMYVLERDKESSIKTENDWNRFQIMGKYDF